MTNRKMTGFSLIELIIAAGIMITLGGVILTTSIDGLETFSSVHDDQKFFSSFVEMYSRIDNFVRVAVEFPTSYTTPAGVTYTAGPTTLIMKLKGIASTGAPECPSFDYVVYHMTGGNDLHELVISAPDSARVSHDQVVVYGLTELLFTQDKPAGLHRSVTLDATLTHKSRSHNSIRSHQQIMVARND